MRGGSSKKGGRKKTEARNSIFFFRDKSISGVTYIVYVYFRTCYRLEWQYIIGNKSIYRLMYIWHRQKSTPPWGCSVFLPARARLFTRSFSPLRGKKKYSTRLRRDNHGRLSVLFRNKFEKREGETWEGYLGARISPAILSVEKSTIRYRVVDWRGEEKKGREGGDKAEARSNNVRGGGLLRYYRDDYRGDLILHVHMRLALTRRNGGRKNKDTHRGRITSYRLRPSTRPALPSIFIASFSSLLCRSIVVCIARLESICPHFSSSSRDSTRNLMPWQRDTTPAKQASNLTLIVPSDFSSNAFTRDSIPLPNTG